MKNSKPNCLFFYQGLCHHKDAPTTWLGYVKPGCILLKEDPRLPAGCRLKRPSQEPKVNLPTDFYTFEEAFLWCINNDANFSVPAPYPTPPGWSWAEGEGEGGYYLSPSHGNPYADAEITAEMIEAAKASIGKKKPSCTN